MGEAFTDTDARLDDAPLAARRVVDTRTESDCSVRRDADPASERT